MWNLEELQETEYIVVKKNYDFMLFLFFKWQFYWNQAQDLLIRLFFITPY